MFAAVEAVRGLAGLVEGRAFLCYGDKYADSTSSISMSATKGARVVATPIVVTGHDVVASKQCQQRRHPKRRSTAPYNSPEVIQLTTVMKGADGATKLE
jgi:hypothetical protein